MEIRFRTVESKLKSLVQNVKCTARVVHNDILNLDDMAAEIASRNGMDEHRAKYIAEILSSYMIDALCEGKRLDFGKFALSLSIKGCIDGSNGAFTPGVNSLKVRFELGKDAKRRFAAIRPVNDRVFPAPRITSVIDGIQKKEGAIALGTTVYLAGENLMTDSGRGDEAIWLCDKAGARLLKGRILKCTSSTLDCEFDSAPDIPAGKYRLLLVTRSGNHSLATPATCTRIVTLSDAR